MTIRDEKFNGWTNYATWSVHLELFDGWDVDHEVTHLELRETAENAVSHGSNGNALAKQFALAFISNVNWYEISQHLNEEE